MNTSKPTQLYRFRQGWLYYTLLCLIIGQLTAYWSNAYFGHDWDRNLIKPSITQFNWVFFVGIWTINYSTMGMAAWSVKQTGDTPPTKRALRWFWLQYVLCLLWMPVVHGTGWVGSAVLMDFVVGVPAFITGYFFWRTSRRAFWWFVPYLIWTLITTHAKIWMFWLNTL